MRNCLACAGAFCVWSVATAIAQAPPQLWVQQFGTSLTDKTTGAAVDSTGGVYVTGWTRGSLGSPNLGAPDAFVARYDETGAARWIRQFGTERWDQPNALVPDGVGGVFVTGYTGGSLGGPNPTPNSADVFLIRFDSAGGQIWVRQIGTDREDQANAMAPDGSGGVFVAGESTGQFGGNDPLDRIFLVRYDAAGNQLWLRQFGIPGVARCRSMAADGSGGFYFCGTTGGNVAGQNPDPPTPDVVLARFDGAGERLWVRQFGAQSADDPLGAAPDGSGGVYVGGDTFALGGPPLGGDDAFLTRYDSAGNQLWLRKFGTNARDWISALTPDGAGGAFFTGITRGSLGGTHAGSDDAFIGQYNSAGVRLWMRQLGTSSSDQAAGLAPDAAGGVYVAGSTQGSLGGPNQGDDDVFLARFGGSCYPNCDGSTAPSALNVGDFVCFMRFFAAADPYANCDNSTMPPVLNVADFVCFQERFAAGCP